MTHRRHGTVLIIAMVVVFALAAMVLALGKQVRTQALASANDLAAQKAIAAELGAEQFALSVLTDYRDSLDSLSETDYTAVPVGDSYFWITRPDYGDSTLPTWGFVDESSKMPLNTALQPQLLGVPGITDEIAGAIVDWRDTDDTASTNGAESSTYSQYGYDAKNADFETVDELMLVNGMTHDLLYGPPAGQAPSTPTVTASGSDWYLTHGVFDYFTAWGTQPSMQPDGVTARVSVNALPDRQALRSLLGDLIGAGDAKTAVDAAGQLSNFPNLFEFANMGHVTAENFAKIENYLTINSQETTLKGKININTVSREVLIALGTIPEADVDSILAARPQGIIDYPNSMAWFYDILKTRAAVRDDIGDTFCATGRQFSADIVAASGNGRGFRHVRIVVDTTSSPPRIVYRRDLTDKGWPLDPAILDSLKSGAGVGTTGSTGVGITGGK